MVNQNKNNNLLYGIDDKPLMVETVVLGLQHYLTMFGSTLAIPLILSKPLGLEDKPVELGWLIATMFFVSGITTLLQTTWGNRLPIVQGGTFSFLAPTIAICGMAALNNVGWEVRMQHVQGAIIAGSVFEIGIGVTGLVGKLLRFVGPITIAPTIALIGLALFKFGAPIGINDSGGIVEHSCLLLFKNRNYHDHLILLCIFLHAFNGGTWNCLR